LRKHLPGVKGHDDSGQRHNQAADHQERISGEVQAAPACSGTKRIAMGYLRFLPTLNNPLIGAAARRGVAGKPKTASGF
jgi:hypothetical protein